MSSQTFTSEFREAMWTTYKYECFFCGKDKNLDEIEIDHLVPESLLDTPDELKRVLKSLGLPENYDIRGFENLVPACSDCNSKKTSRVLHPGYIAIAIGQINANIPNLKKEHAQLIKGRSLRRVVGIIKNSVTKNQFKGSELTAALKDAGIIEFATTLSADSWNRNFPTPNLNTGIAEVEFANEDVRKIWKNTKLMSTIIAHLERGIRNGTASIIPMSQTDGRRLEAVTCREFRIIYSVAVASEASSILIHKVLSHS